MMPMCRPSASYGGTFGALEISGGYVSGCLNWREMNSLRSTYFKYLQDVLPERDDNPTSSEITNMDNFYGLEFQEEFPRFGVGELLRMVVLAKFFWIGNTTYPLKENVWRWRAGE